MHDLIKATLTGLLNQLQLEFSDIRIDDSDEKIIRVDIDSPKASRLIGWHGETINSIQHMLKAIIRTQKKLDRAPFIVLDVDGYRRAQEEKVCRIAEQKADFVRRKKTNVALPPMSPYFRRIVHLYIAGNERMADLTTESIGEGDYRQIVLKLKEGGFADGEELQPAIAGNEQSSHESDEAEESGFENLDV
jgi:spoIIIJ-associated protein